MKTGSARLNEALRGGLRGFRAQSERWTAAVWTRHTPRVSDLHGLSYPTRRNPIPPAENFLRAA